MPGIETPVARNDPDPVPFVGEQGRMYRLRAGRFPEENEILIPVGGEKQQEQRGESCRAEDHEYRPENRNPFHSLFRLKYKRSVSENNKYFAWLPAGPRLPSFRIGFR